MTAIRSSRASKLMEPFFTILPEFKKLLALSSRSLTPGGVLTSRERKSARGDALPLQLASYCPRRRALLASAALGANVSHRLPHGGFAAEQHKCVPSFNIFLWGGN